MFDGPQLRSGIARTGRNESPQAAVRRQLREQMGASRTYSEWVAAALTYDQATGRQRWRERSASSLYDHVMISERLQRLRGLRAAGDDQGLLFEIEEGVHGNLGGMGKPILYRRARFGTKVLIGDYVDEVSEVLLHLEKVDTRKISGLVKKDLFERASHCYGRTGLMMSSGGMLMYFHFGVAKALFEQNLLPKVISGSSAGAIVAAILGTRTDAELKGVFKPENLYFGESWQPNWLERSTGFRRLFGAEDFDKTFERLIPDLTFREAFERSGRNISISVSPCERHQTPRLLNAITSPHVLIRSAVRASCAVPGLFEPVPLQAKDVGGRAVPFLRSRWIDGVFAADLPARQLSRLYGTNHYIVSYINPFLLFTFRDQKTQGNSFKPAIDLFKGISRNMLNSTDRFLGKYVPASTLGVINKVAHDVLSQDFVGDVTITPSQRLFSPLRLVSPMSLEEIGNLMLDGERQAWPRLENIRICTAISRTLDGIIDRAEFEE
jgi:TAG lipase / steryl ester hydrolase / phospholipase A2 / LPA acyltransferase